MDHFDWYVQRVAANASLAVRSAAGEPALAPELLAAYDEETLRAGLRDLRAHVARLHADMGTDPARFGIPLVPDSQVHDAASRRRVRAPYEAPLKLLYALGLCGELVPVAGGHDLVATRTALADPARQLGLRDVPAAARALVWGGLSVDATEADVLALRAGTHRGLPLALQVFCDACRRYERSQLKTRPLPEAFLLLDYRILGRTGSRVRMPRPTLADVLPFVPAHLVPPLRELVQHVETLGYREQIERANLLDGGWKASFVNRELGRTLFGFAACRGTVDLRLCCPEVAPVLPTVDECPPTLRAALLSTSCAQCGGQGCGQELTVSVEGEKRAICHFGPLRAPLHGPGEVAPFRRLLDQQDSLHRQAAT